MSITVEFDTRNLMRFLDDVHNAAVVKSLPQALNKTVTQLRTHAQRDITKRTGITSKIVRSDMRLRKANRAQPIASLSMSGRSRNAINYNGRQVKKGFRYKRGRKTVTVPTGFIGNSGRTAFKRQGKPRLPIEPIYGPNPTRSFGKFKKKYSRFGLTTLDRVFKSQLNYNLSRIRRKRR